MSAKVVEARSRKSRTIPKALFEAFLTKVFAVNVFAIVFARLTNIEFAPTFSGALR